jgi:hypothetical protein
VVGAPGSTIDDRTAAGALVVFFGPGFTDFLMLTAPHRLAMHRLRSPSRRDE